MENRFEQPPTVFTPSSIDETDGSSTELPPVVRRRKQKIQQRLPIRGIN